MLTHTEIKALIQKNAETLFRTPDGWASMERHDRTGSLRNLMFVPCPPATKLSPEGLIDAMRASYVRNVTHLVESILDVRLEE